MTKSLLDSNGATRVASILGVPLADDVVRQWPQMGEVLRTRQLVAEAEGNFPELTLEVGRRLQLDNVVVAEWTCDNGDGPIYRNVTIGELEGGEAMRVTDYWGEPTVTPDWRQHMTDRLDMPGDGIWPDSEHLSSVDDVGAEPSDQTPHLVLANSGSFGPFPEPDAPILPRSARVAGRQDDMKVGQPVAENKAVDVFGLGHLLQCSGQTVHQPTQGGGLGVREVAQSRGVALGLGDQIAPIRHCRSGQRIGVSGIDQVILEEDAAQHPVAPRMFGAHKAVR